MIALVLRLASGSGRTALARQALVVVGTALGSALVLVAVGVATLRRSDLAISGYGGVSCDGAGRCEAFSSAGSDGAVTLDYLVQPGLRSGVVAGFLLCVVPLLVFVSTASRVAARRRDERLASLRLAGATQGQVRALAVLDALVGGVCGALLGAGLYAAARATVLALDDGQAAAVVRATTPPLAAALGAVALLIAGLVVGATLTLRRVQLGPLDVSRRALRRRPTPAGLLLLLPLLVLPVVERGDPYEHARDVPLLLGCLVLTMLGLVLSAPWLSSAAGRFAADRTGSPALLLAGRRLEHDPGAQARATVPVVLVVLAAALGLVSLAESVAVSSDPGFVRRGYGAAGLGMAVSLAVGAAGLLLTTTESALERRRTFAALQASGVAVATLRRTLLSQAALPVLLGSVLATACGLLLGLVAFGTDHVLSGIGLLALLLPLVATLAAVVATSLTLPVLRSCVTVDALRAP